MRKILIITLVLLIPGMSYAEDTHTFSIITPQGFLEGNDWRDLPESSKKVYIMGAIDGIEIAIEIASALESPSSLQWINKCVKGMRSDQVHALVEKYVNANPQDWHQSMNVIVYTALYDSCPNSPKRTKGRGDQFDIDKVLR
jgi:hypothetical protein